MPDKPRPPVIGISCCLNFATNYFHVAQDYVQAVEAAGGVPVILPHTSAQTRAKFYAQCIDGLLLSGGGDVDSYLFGQEPWPWHGSIDPDRDVFELALTAQALQKKMPVLGICRGMQVLNIAAGGNVSQDMGRLIPKPYKHMQEAPRWHPTHGINIVPNSRLHTILKTSQSRVNSFHHQVVDKIAPGMVITATAADDAVEAIESVQPDMFALGVQFHPENLWLRQPQMLQLFVALVQASAGQTRGTS